jgi:hypothetical protein
MGFVVDKAALGQVFSEYFIFSCQSFHRLFHTHYHLSSVAGTVGQIVADSTPMNLKKRSKLRILVQVDFIFY